MNYFFKLEDGSIIHGPVTRNSLICDGVAISNIKNLSDERLAKKCGYVIGIDEPPVMDEQLEVVDSTSWEVVDETVIKSYIIRASTEEERINNLNLEKLEIIEEAFPTSDQMIMATLKERTAPAEVVTAVTNYYGWLDELETYRASIEAVVGSGWDYTTCSQAPVSNCKELLLL